MGYELFAAGSIQKVEVYGRSLDEGGLKYTKFYIVVDGVEYSMTEQPQVSRFRSSTHFDWQNGNIGFVLGPFVNGEWYSEVHISDAGVNVAGMLQGYASLAFVK